MSTVIEASELQPGDLYRGVMLGAVERGQAYRVITARTYVAAKTYRVIEAVNVSTGNHASINLSSTTLVARLAPVDRRDVCAAIDSANDGDQFTVVLHDGEMWW
ncbi:hypothetical protein SEA_DONNY_84 [Mycobacterium phage Donny]|uniref:Uncharacterized protein n=1 Tax=Mycobacterium phage Donny TaxID=2530126 RepID=A0A481VRM1_9CAUD|nr:hypothetical protein SEA_DONNY_84 [Mycobacterium phage Donny]